MESKDQNAELLPIRPRHRTTVNVEVFIEYDDTSAGDFDDTIEHLIQQLAGYHGVCSVVTHVRARVPVSTAPASPLTVPKCVKCGHSDTRDADGKCLYDKDGSQEPGVTIYYCGCECEFPTAGDTVPARTSIEMDESKMPEGYLIARYRCPTCAGSKTEEFGCSITKPLLERPCQTCKGKGYVKPTQDSGHDSNRLSGEDTPANLTLPRGLNTHTAEGEADVETCPYFKLPASFTFDPDNLDEQAEIETRKREHRRRCARCSEGEGEVPAEQIRDHMQTLKFVNDWLWKNSKASEAGLPWHHPYKSDCAEMILAVLSATTQPIHEFDPGRVDTGICQHRETPSGEICGQRWDCPAHKSDRPVSQDAQEVLERARRWVLHYHEVVDGQDGKIAQQLKSMYHDTARLIDDLITAIDAARPKVSEDDQKAAREIAWHYFPEFEVNPVKDDLIARIASDRASVRDAARLAERERKSSPNVSAMVGYEAGMQAERERVLNLTQQRLNESNSESDPYSVVRHDAYESGKLAERERIRGAIKPLYHDSERNDTRWNTAIEAVLKKIDGQPVDGGK